MHCFKKWKWTKRNKIKSKFESQIKSKLENVWQKTLLLLCATSWRGSSGKYDCFDIYSGDYFSIRLELKYSNWLRLSRTVLSNPVLSRLFSGFFPDFLDQRDQKKVVFSRYCQFGKWCLVSSRLKRARECRPLNCGIEGLLLVTFQN